MPAASAALPPAISGPLKPQASVNEHTHSFSPQYQSKQAGKQASKQASQQASQPASQASKPSQPASKPASKPSQQASQPAGEEAGKQASKHASKNISLVHSSTTCALIHHLCAHPPSRYSQMVFPAGTLATSPVSHVTWRQFFRRGPPVKALQYKAN